MVALRRVLPPAAGLLALLLAPAFATPHQPAPADKEDDKEKKAKPAFTLPTDKAVVAKLKAAADYVATEGWAEATKTLQGVLEGDDVFVPVGGEGATTFRSARREAERMLGALPRPGRDYYRRTYGPKAEALLKAALKDDKPEQLAQVATTYLYTDAGPEALAALAARQLELGCPGLAALSYERLLRQRGVARWAPGELFQATQAFRRAGDRAHADVTGKELLSRVGPEGLRLGKKTFTREELAKELARLGPAPLRDEWPVYGGNAARSDQGIGGPPFMDLLWKQKVVLTEETERFLKQAERQLERNRQPLLPAFYPVTATGGSGARKYPLLVFRSYWGIHAIHTRTGKLAWDSPSSWSLDRTLVRGADARKAQAMNQWLNYYLNAIGAGGMRPQVVFENSVLGALSSDEDYLYAVEDLAVPPAILDPFTPGAGFGAEVNEAIRHNKLQAFDLPSSGKIKWELGGIGKGELDNAFFLGAPLPLEGRLYVLTQKDRDLRLAVLEPKNGKLLALHKLATVPRSMKDDPIRRTQAAHLAYGDGVLVCPTNAGAVVGFDLLAGRLAWAFRYAEKEAAPEPAPGAPRFRRGGVPPGWVMLPNGQLVPVTGMKTTWKVTAPVIADGKVVFTAPDGQRVHCLRLADGSPAWSQKRGEDDLYLGGVYAGRVLIVGKKSVRGLSLARGETLWTLETGLPSGQGVASDNVYYLALKEGARSKEPEVCAIDVCRGIVLAHTRSRNKDVPGNLLFVGGDVISQTATQVTAYPQLKRKLAQMDDLLRRDPADPAGLVERAELRRDGGDLAGAVADLRKALERKPAADLRDKARALLYETLTDALQRDFGAFEKYLPDYEALSKAEDKEKARERRERYYLVVGTGRERQGKVLEALKAYLTLAELGPGTELMAVPDQPALRVRRDVWARGRIADLLKRATPEQRKQLEEEIERRRKALQGRKDVDALRTFVALFGADTAAGREARLELARLLADKEDYAAADRLLQEVRRAGSARALLELARLQARRGLLADAVYYYRALAREYPRTAVEGEKTGADLLEDLKTDKRYLPYLKEEAPVFAAGRLRATEERGSFPYNNQTYRFPEEGEPLPFFRRKSLALRFDIHKLQLLDAVSGEERWSFATPRTNFQQLMYANGQGHLVKFPFQNVGHLVVLPVGHLVFGIDPVSGRKLWERDLLGPAGPGGPQFRQVIPDPGDRGLQVLWADGWTQRLGAPLVIGPSALCLPTRTGLQGIDPLTGQTIWVRADVVGNVHVFGDDRTACVVVMAATDRPREARAFRLADGREVSVPPFADAYAKRLRVLGANLLLSDTDAGGRVRLRLYDVLAGKDVWEKTYPAKSFVLRSAEPGVAGAVAPNGTVSVLDINTGKEVLAARMSPEHLVKVDEVRLLADRERVYLACVGPTDPDILPFGGVRSSLLAGSGLQALPVNGEVYAFARGGGKTLWHATVPEQMVVLDRFEELPVVLFTATYQKWEINGAGRHMRQVTSLRAIGKREGKFQYYHDLSAGITFHTLRVDAGKGRVELTGYQMKLIISTEGGK